jgi:D-xylose transport system ATP-binding protein
MTTPPAPVPIRRPRQQIVALRGIDKRFGGVRALNDVDLDVYQSEVVAIVGDNGAGKSTLAKILAGVLTPNGGSISFFGETVSINSPSDARNLGVATVFQDLALCENLDVVENLWLGRELVAGGTLREAEMEQRSWSLLRELGAKITSLRTPVSSLSGGQRQIVAIARALIGEPNVMILDEPTAALGVAQSAEVLNLIERLRERGLGVILISHSIADVQAVADRIVVLRLGRTNGEFRGAEMTSEAIIAAITGAVDNAVTRREAARRPIRDARPDPTSTEVARVNWASDLLPDPGAAKTVASARFR